VLLSDGTLLSRQTRRIALRLRRGFEGYSGVAVVEEIGEKWRLENEVCEWHVGILGVSGSRGEPFPCMGSRDNDGIDSVVFSFLSSNKKRYILAFTGLFYILCRALRSHRRMAPRG